MRSRIPSTINADQVSRESQSSEKAPILKDRIGELLDMGLTGNNIVTKKKKIPKAPRTRDTNLDVLQMSLEESRASISLLNDKLQASEIELGRLHQHIAIQQQENQQLQARENQQLHIRELGNAEQLQALEQKQAHILILEQQELALRLEIQNWKDTLQQVKAHTIILEQQEVALRLEIQNLKDSVEQRQTQFHTLQHHFVQKQDHYHAKEVVLNVQITELENQVQQQDDRLGEFHTKLQEEQLQTQLLLTEHIETLEQLDFEWQQSLIAERLQLAVNQTELQNAHTVIRNQQNAMVARNATVQLQVSNLQNERQEFAERQLLLRQALSTNFQRREVESRTEILQLKRQLATAKQLSRQYEKTAQQMNMDIQAKDSLLSGLTTTENQVIEQMAMYQTEIRQLNLLENSLQHGIVELEANNHSLLSQIQTFELERVAQQQQLDTLNNEMNLEQQHLQQQLAELGTHSQILQQQIYEFETERATNQLQSHDFVLREQTLQQTITELDANNLKLVEQLEAFNTERTGFHTRHSEYVESTQQAIQRKDAEFAQISSQHNEIVERMKNNPSRRSISPIQLIGKQLTGLRTKLFALKEKKVSTEPVKLSEKSLKIFSDLKVALR